MKDSLTGWKKELVAVCKKEDGAIAAAELAAATKMAKAKGFQWPKTMKEVQVYKVIYEVFTGLHNKEDELKEWDEDKYGSIYEAMMEMNNFYEKVGTAKILAFVDWLRSSSRDFHEIHKRIVHLFKVKETFIDDDDITSPSAMASSS